MSDYILKHDTRWSQRNLIKGLNAKLQGWAAYHRVEEATDIFRHLDSVVSALLLKLLQEIHPQKDKDEIIKKYWYKEADGTKFFALPDRSDVRLIHLRDVVLTTHTPLNTKANPYLDSGYFEERLENHEINKVNGKYKAVWERQKGKCYYCGNPIEINQDKKIIFKTLSGDKSVKNMVYIHSMCEDNELVLCRVDIENPSQLDVFNIIQEVIDIDSAKHDCTKKRKKELYFPLKEYFKKSSKAYFALSFSQIEKILNRKLCNSAYKYSAYWYNSISDCWLSNGYRLAKVDFKSKKVTFRKNSEMCSKLKIPEVFLTDNIPNDAKYELERFFEHIKKKYAL